MVSYVTANNMSPSSRASLSSYSPQRSRTLPRGNPGLYGLLVKVTHRDIRIGVLLACGAWTPLPIVKESVQSQIPLSLTTKSFVPSCTETSSFVSRTRRPPLFFFPSGESSTFLPSHHLRCCPQNPVLLHCTSNCVCLRVRLNFREHPACSNPNSCFSWAALCSWMLSILCDTTMLRRACFHACSGTSGATWRSSIVQITKAQ